MKTEKISLKIQGRLKIINQHGITKYEDHNDINQPIAINVVANRLVGGVFQNNNGITQLEFNYDTNLTGLVPIATYEVDNDTLTTTTIITDENFSGLLNHLYIKTPSIQTFSSRENINITKEEGETLYVTWKLKFII